MDTSTWLLQRKAPAARGQHPHLPFLQHAAARTFTLAEGDAWSVQSPRAGLVISCLAGRLWVTVEGDPEDHILVAPDRFTVPTRGRVAVLALSPASIEVTPAPLLAH